MKNYTYKCVSVPSMIRTDGKKKLHSQAVKSYETIINEAAVGGWELVNIDTVTSVKSPGCFAALMGNKGETVSFKLLVFVKEI